MVSMMVKRDFSSRFVPYGTSGIHIWDMPESGAGNIRRRVKVDVVSAVATVEVALPDYEGMKRDEVLLLAAGAGMAVKSKTTKKAAIAFLLAASN